MSQLPTLIISEDEDRTLVDHHTVHGPTRPPIDDLADASKGRPRTRGLFLYLRHRASGLVLAATLALGLALSASVYYQWRAVQRLSEALVVIGAGLPAHPASEPGQPPAPTSTPKDRWGATVAEITPVERSALEARGATLLGANDFSRALVHYRKLADQFPAETVFQDVVSALENKLRCNGLTSSGCR